MTKFKDSGPSADSSSPDKKSVEQLTAEFEIAFQEIRRKIVPRPVARTLDELGTGPYHPWHRGKVAR